MKKRPSGKLLFRVALVADTHVNEKEDFSASPYPANAEANARARHVLERVARSDAAFCIHLGDMVNPVPELPTYAEAARNFHALAGRLPMPLHLMPGNHDVGDKPVDWMPAGTVDAATIELYRKTFGPDHFSFDHGDCHFVIVNSPLINSGLPVEAEQAAWLEADLAGNVARRTFLFSHYPPYVSDPDEPGSYDNIDEPGRGWLLDLIRRYRPEALFSAHVHNFWYDVIGDTTEFYVLPSTCFVRHDYAEMYRIEGGDQQGRNDTAKLGHVTLDIHERGHVAHYHRSYGATLADGATTAEPAPARPHVRTTSLTGVYVDMRHAWAEEMTVAPSGAVDEFRRKQARNDYPVMALWEMGLRGMRVPLQDLADPRVRRRMSLMTDVGHLFHVYRYGLPDDAERAILREHAGLVAELELVTDWDGIDAPAIAALKDATGLKIVLSRVNRKDAARHSGGRYNHLISHGFTLAEAPELTAFAHAHAGLADGFQFTIPRDIAPWDAARDLAGFAESSGCRPYLYVKSTGGSPAETHDDEIANAARFGEAVMASAGFAVPVILDTFDDADRGYFTRTGLIDRRFNPRLAGEIVADLVLALDDGTDEAGREAGDTPSWRPAEGETPALVDPDGRRLTIEARADEPLAVVVRG